jgi:hypothetical protein
LKTLAAQSLKDLKKGFIGCTSPQIISTSQDVPRLGALPGSGLPQYLTALDSSMVIVPTPSKPSETLQEPVIDR